MCGPGPGLRAPGAEPEIGGARDHCSRDVLEIGSGEGTVAIHEAHDIGGGRVQARPTRGAETAVGFVYDPRAQSARDHGGVVGRAVVDDNRVVSGRQAPQNARDGAGFVQGRKDHVGHTRTVSARGAETGRAPLTIRETRTAAAAGGWVSRPTLPVVPTEPCLHVLVVEDDPTVREVVTRYLEHEGIEVDAVGDGNLALERAAVCWPDLVVLDLMLPGLDGLEVCRRLRAQAPIPVIMLTARGDEEDRIVGLELGADDYISKPFSPRELVARVRAVLRRASGGVVNGNGTSTIVAGDVRIDVGAREVFRSDELLALTAREFELLVFLASSPRHVFRRDELFEQVWGYTYGDAATVTVHVRRLREKVEADPANPSHLVTVWGVGYRWDP